MYFRNFRLGPRDERILQDFRRFGILSTTQIRDRFFPGIAKTTVLRRLRELESKTLIKRVQGLPHAEWAWCNEKRGAEVAGDHGTIPKYLNRNSIYHDVTLTETRMLLESLGLGERFTPEFELKGNMSGQSYRSTKDKQIPDGIFIAKQKGELRAIALELELTAKGWGRYKKIVSHYERVSKLHYVWYIVGSQSVEKILMPLWKKRTKHWGGPTLLVSNLSDLRRNLDHASVRSEDGDTRPLSDVFDLTQIPG